MTQRGSGAGIDEIERRLRNVRLRWYGHVQKSERPLLENAQELPVPVKRKRERLTKRWKGRPGGERLKEEAGKAWNKWRQIVHSSQTLIEVNTFVPGSLQSVSIYRFLSKFEAMIVFLITNDVAHNLYFKCTVPQGTYLNKGLALGLVVQKNIY